MKCKPEKIKDGDSLYSIQKRHYQNVVPWNQIGLSLVSSTFSDAQTSKKAKI